MVSCTLHMLKMTYLLPPIVSSGRSSDMVILPCDVAKFVLIQVQIFPPIILIFPFQVMTVSAWAGASWQASTVELTSFRLWEYSLRRFTIHAPRSSPLVPNNSGQIARFFSEMPSILGKVPNISACVWEYLTRFWQLNCQVLNMQVLIKTIHNVSPEIFPKEAKIFGQHSKIWATHEYVSQNFELERASTSGNLAQMSAIRRVSIT